MKIRLVLAVAVGLLAVSAFADQSARPPPASSVARGKLVSNWVAPVVDMTSFARKADVITAISNISGGTAEQFLIRNLGLVFNNNYTRHFTSTGFNDNTPTCGMFAIYNCQPDVNNSYRGTVPTQLILRSGLTCFANTATTNPAVAGYVFGSPSYVQTYPMADGRFCFTPLTSGYFLADVNDQAKALIVLDPNSKNVTSDRFYLHDMYGTAYQTYSSVTTVMTQDMITSGNRSLQLVEETSTAQAPAIQ